MKKELITKDMTIGEVIEAYPVTSEILMGMGVHCIGCGARFLETIEQGLKGHGISGKNINKTMNALNEAAKKIITVSEKAAKKLKAILKKEKKQGYCLRVQVVKGKSGVNYGLDFDKSAGKNDIVLKEQGLTIIIAKKSLQNVKGAKIDFIEGPEPGFSIRSPRKK